MHAVFLDQKTFSDQLSFNAIKDQVTELTCYPLTTEKQVLSHCQDADIIITNKVRLTKEVLNQLPKLSLICIAATGTNNVDLITAKNLGITVSNVRGYSTPSVTQYVFAQILAYFSQTHQHDNNVKEGRWQTHHSFCYHGDGSTEISEKTLAIVGYGELGKGVAKVANAFGMKVLVAERPNANKIREGRVSFTCALQQADVLTLHCPENEQTKGLINTDSLALMKPTAMLINTARGAIIDNIALIKALKNKRIAYAALDVLDQEPPPAEHPLLQYKLQNNNSNLSITAHIAWASIESQQRLLNLIAQNIADFKVGKTTNCVV
ncbi:D-2-hydroxyacid dehydrogenase [Thalassotalea profundi]|uniref:Lactate dehydrogenase n=1 Tax=Thalassotalea profundi TaxID=2036687 RepID=A0ABQ3IW36_9GAMM|nr:D-2-hydroxyacid dehydrogenase [Thalassotalea profundi]GHE94635.1 lactate dehydrogenase [Thalassotalea profundi]